MQVDLVRLGLRPGDRPLQLVESALEAVATALPRGMRGAGGVDLLLFGQVLAPVAELISPRVGGLQFEDRVCHGSTARLHDAVERH